jgi:hypothetical protein
MKPVTYDFDVITDSPAPKSRAPEQAQPAPPPRAQEERRETAPPEREPRINVQAAE